MLVEIRYSLNEVGRKASLVAGGNGKEEQKITLNDSDNRLMDYISVSHDGLAYLSMIPYQNNYYLSTRLTDWCGAGTGYLQSYCAESYQVHQCSAPITSVDDVLKIISEATARKAAIENQIPALNAAELAIYESKRAEKEKYEVLKAALNHARDEAREDLRAEYAVAINQVESIRTLISGKSRIRTTQISTIING